MIRGRVNTTRERQHARFNGTATLHNAAMGVREIREYCQLEEAGEQML